MDINNFLTMADIDARYDLTDLETRVRISSCVCAKVAGRAYYDPAKLEAINDKLKRKI